MDPSTLDPNSLIPQSAVSSFTGLFVVSTLISVAIFIIFAVFYIVSAIRRWKVESAVLRMDKELGEIKELLRAAHPSTTGSGIEPNTAQPHTLTQD